MTTTTATGPVIDAAARERTAYIAGLRGLASILEDHPEVPLPYQGSASEMTLHFLHGDDPRAALAAAVRVLPCPLRKEVRDSGEYGSYLDLYGQIEGLRIRLTAFRDSVCTRVVTGTHQETRKVKDPDALAAVPEIEVTEDVEDVEWRCSPLLAGGE